MSRPSLEFLRPPAGLRDSFPSCDQPCSDSTQAMRLLFVIAFGAIWPIVLATIHGFAAVEPRLYEGGAVAADVRGSP